MKSKYIYPVSFLFVLCWWLIAFHQPIAHEINIPCPSDAMHRHLSTSVNHMNTQNLLCIDRDELKQALNGDVMIMGQLIADWDLEAEIAQHQGFATVKRLERDTFIKTQLITKSLTSCSPSNIEALRDQQRSPLVIDDSGSPFDLTNPPQVFLPQTYLSAGILLALCDPYSITALPKGMRLQDHIYSSELTNQIPYDLDSFHMEKLYTCKPDVSLISEKYTHPLTLQALESQNIPKFHVPEISTFEDIENVTCLIGHLCNRPFTAELMALFLKAAAMAIDNKREISLSDISKKRILVVNYYSNFSLPGTNTLTRYMIDRMGLTPPKQLNGSITEERWSTPISEEMIIHNNPEKLIIITSSKPEYVLGYFYQTTLFQHIDAARNQQVTILDESIQQTISQYVLLAYYDLNHALVDLHGQ